MLPNHLMVSEKGSFAERTILVRKPTIIADVISHNDYPEPIVDGLRAFADEIGQNQPLSPPQEMGHNDEHWQAAWRSQSDRTWHRLPWYFAEAFFYRRLLEIVHYFQEGPLQRRDPFQSQKDQALQAGLDHLARTLRLLPKGSDTSSSLLFWMHASLWGNRADLSNLVVDRDKGHVDADASRDHLLIDHGPALGELLTASETEILHVVADNCGAEILADLALVAFLLQKGLLHEVHLHLKKTPFFVSDAMIKDVEASIQALAQAGDAELRKLADRLGQEQRAGRLLVHSHPFWTSSLFFDEMPSELSATLASADLTLYKGDANYRRLVEDRHWPPTTPLESTVSVPGPLATLRTLKSEVVVGLQIGQAEALASVDPEWMINGKRGVIHLLKA